jgi:hypothetical protein
MAQPLRFIKKTLEGGRPQDELTPRLDPRYARGLRGSWTRKETEYTVAYQWRIDRIPRRDRNHEKSSPPPRTPQLHTPEESDRNRKESQPYQNVPQAAKGDQGPQNPFV